MILKISWGLGGQGPQGPPDPPLKKKKKKQDSLRVRTTADLPEQICVTNGDGWKLHLVVVDEFNVNRDGLIDVLLDSGGHQSAHLC